MFFIKPFRTALDSYRLAKTLWFFGEHAWLMGKHLGPQGEPICVRRMNLNVSGTSSQPLGIKDKQCSKELIFGSSMGHPC